MSNDLTTLRGELVAAVTATPLPNGTQAFVTVPEEAEAPLVVTGAGQPYLSFTEGAGYGAAVARLQLMAVVETGENETEDESLDELLLTLIGRLHGSRFLVESVDQPIPMNLHKRDHLGVAINVWTDIQIPDPS